MLGSAESAGAALGSSLATAPELLQAARHAGMVEDPRADATGGGTRSKGPPCSSNSATGRVDFRSAESLPPWPGSPPC
jgi:hypothetical protein